MDLTRMTWPEIDALDRATPIVFPIAALEQHGHHLPVFTDSLLLGEIVRRVRSSAESERVLWAPLQWLGNSHHHLDMPGTVSADPRGYLNMLRDQAESFLMHDFTRVVFINGHGGNTLPSQQVCFELRQKYRDVPNLLIATLTYWDACAGPPSGAKFSQSEMGHACEWETSMIMAIDGTLVRGQVKDVAAVAAGQGASPGYRGWTMRDRSVPGHIGAPAAATPEKGELLLAHFAAGVRGYLDRICAWQGSDWDLPTT